MPGIHLIASPEATDLNENRFSPPGCPWPDLARAPNGLCRHHGKHVNEPPRLPDLLLQGVLTLMLRGSSALLAHGRAKADAMVGMPT